MVDGILTVVFWWAKPVLSPEEKVVFVVGETGCYRRCFEE
jgi:hypothetical protein